MYRCESCQITTGLFFCPNCGSILRYPQFFEEDELLKRRLQTYIRNIIQDASVKKVCVSDFSNIEALTNATQSIFNSHIKYLNDTYCKNVSENNDELHSIVGLLLEFAEKLKNKDCYMAVAGKIGAGKKTIIEALLGKDFYDNKSTAETTVLTKFRYSEKGYYIKLSYYTTYEWEELWQSVVSANLDSIRNDGGDYLSEFHKSHNDEIKKLLLNREDEEFQASNEAELKELISKYTSCDSPYHFFVKEAEVGMADFSLPNNVIIVGTLGIDDPISYRVDLSNKYLKKSNIILLCIKADGHLLNSSEYEEYAKLFSCLNDKQQVYILGTQYDIPNNFAEYWNENTNPEFIKHFATKSYFNSDSAVKDRILHTSAWYYNIIQKAKNDVTFLENEYNVDYLAEVLCRTLGTTVAYQYGTDANSLKKCLNENIDKIESMTNLPYVRNYIVLGPIRDFERNSINDLKNIYIKITDTTHSKYHKTLNPRKSTLITRMIELDSKLYQQHNEDESKSKHIRKLIQSL